MLWSGIIAAAQFLDATKHVFPFARLHKAASEMTVALELLCVDAEAEWLEIETADLSVTDIAERRKRLAKLKIETEYKHFPEGFAPGDTLERRATKEANAYLAATYGQYLWSPQAKAPRISYGNRGRRVRGQHPS